MLETAVSAEFADLPELLEVARSRGAIRFDGAPGEPDGVIKVTKAKFLPATVNTYTFDQVSLSLCPSISLLPVSIKIGTQKKNRDACFDLEPKCYFLTG